MSKKVLILSGSPRIGGNSDILCDEFMKGAIESGNDVEKINVSKKKIDYCKACYYCQKSGGECIIKDDMAEILQKIIDSDVLVKGEFLNLNEKNFKYNNKIGKNIYDLNKNIGQTPSIKKNNTSRMTFNKFNKINNNFSYNNNNFGNKYYNRNFYSGSNCWKKL